MVTKGKIFYGYWIVLVGFVTCTLNNGLGYYGFSVINKSIGDEFDWSRSEVTVAFLIFFIAAALGCLFVGRLADKHGPRKVMLIGAVVMSLSLALLSRTSALWDYYLLHLFLGIGLGLMGTVPVSVNISNWFYRMRGTMQGVAFVGIGLGGPIIAPLLGNYLIPNFGWRGAYLVMAFLVLVIVLPLLFFVVKDHPRQKGLRPYGLEAVEIPAYQSSETEKVTGLSLRMAVRTGTFWVVVLTSAVYGMSMTGPVQNQISILTGQNFTAAEAVVGIGVIGLFSAAGKFLFGLLCDRTDPKYAAAIAYILVAFSLVTMIQATSMAHVWLYAALLGLGMGGWAPNLAVLATEYFGLKHFGSVLGAFTMTFTIGEAIGPVVTGFVYDQTGSYRLILIVFIVLCFVSVPIIVALKKPKLVSN